MRRSLLIILVSMVCTLAWGQTLTSYTCDFENPQELQNWVVNAGSRGQTSANRWYRGAAGSFGLNSNNGLYIATAEDTTVSAYSGSTAGFTVAYREMTLAAGTYTLQVDWIFAGMPTEAIYVFWVPATQNTNSNYGNSVGLPSWIPAQRIQGQGSAWWQSSSCTFTANGGLGKVVVLFYYSKGVPNNPGPAIDNIEIHQGTCAAPTNVRYDGNTVSLTWNGSASGTYDVLVFNNHTRTSTSYTNIQGTTCQLSGQTTEGMYYFYVRQTCDSACHSTWVFTNKFVWIKGARCIDYLDLTPDNSGAAKCFYGSTENIKQNSGQVDYGYWDEHSRHTIHYVTGETDPRTGGRLKTIPDGEIASVRLGGYWETTGNMSSTVEYEYDVQAGVSDLLVLKYAAILEYADYHSESEEARFKLEVLRNGQVLNQCAQGDFKAGYGGTNAWHVYQYEGNRPMYYNDWQTITVSLRQYVGQRLTIRLTAYSCTQTVHIGYAYFTINCEGGDLQGISCGDYGLDHFQAPEGFDYRWYKESDPSVILSDSSVLQISTTDTAIYMVDLITKGKTQCYYSLVANPNPRGPKAQVSVAASPTDCKNTVIFTNTSAVVRTNRIDGTTYIDTTEHISSLQWDFGDGSPVVNNMANTVTHQYPDEGGTYTVRVMAGMSGDVCVDTLDIPVHMPDLHAAAYTDTINTCAESYRDSHGRIRYASAGDFIDTLGVIINRYGCTADSLRWVFFRKETLHVDSALICENESFRWYADNKDYRAPHALSQTDTFTFELRDISHEGCDSITRLILTVNPIVRSDLQENAAKHDTLLICPNGDNIIIPYELYSGLVDSVVVTMAKGLDGKGKQVKETFEVGDPVTLAVSDTLRPDIYTAYVEFKSQACPAAPVPVVFETMYLPRIVQQKDGFIAIINENYNYGHYKFDQYQWYRDGMPIVGAITSYIVVTPEDLGHTFFVILRREGEERFYRSCDFVYTGYTNLEELIQDSYASPEKLILNGQLYIIHDGRWFDALGREMVCPYGK